MPLFDSLWLPNALFLMPATVGSLAAVAYVRRLRPGADGAEAHSGAYALFAVALWAIASVGLALSAAERALPTFPLLGGPIQVRVLVPVFAFIGVVGYATHSVAEHFSSFFDSPGEAVRRKILVSIASRVIITPYLAVAITLLISDIDPATELFFALFTGLFIKVVLNALNELGTKLLPARLQEQLEKRREKETPGQTTPPHVTAEDLEPLVPEVWNRLRGHARVVGVAVQRKETGGLKTPDLAFVVRVERKGGPGLRAGDEVPKSLDVRLRDGRTVSVMTDVVEVGRPTVNGAVLTAAPVFPATVISNEATPSNRGTISCVVRDVDTGDALLLTCYHVVRHPSHPWEGVTDPPRHATLLGETETGVIATLVRGLRSSWVDAAVARPEPGIELRPGIAGLGIPGQPSTVWQSDVDRRPVEVRGAFTRPAKGMIRGKNVAAVLDYGGGEVAELFDLILIDRLTGPGDSGALVLDEQDRSIGIVVGIDDRNTYVIPITGVLNALRVQIP